MPLPVPRPRLPAWQPQQAQQPAALPPQLLAAQQAAFLFQQAQQQALLAQQAQQAQPPGLLQLAAAAQQPALLSARAAADAPWVPYLLPAAFRSHFKHKGLASTMRQVGTAGGASPGQPLTRVLVRPRAEGVLPRVP